MGGGQFSQSKEPGGVSELQAKLLGPDYNYSAHIKSPEEIGMSGDGNFGALADDIAGLMGYADFLITGSCKLGNCVSTTGRPLGTKFFLETPVTCTDKATTKDVKRSIYINNVPDGSIPFISAGMGIRFPDFAGLVPGVMSNLSQINPMQMLLAFVSGPGTTCQAITLDTINSNDVHKVVTAYVTNKDIEVMNSAWFTVPGNPKPSREQLKELDESFCNRSDVSSLGATRVDYSRMPNDLLIKFYYTSLGLLGIYIFLKMMLRKRK
jgi:hypothetical protein